MGANEQCPTCGAGRNEETDDLYARIDALTASLEAARAAPTREQTESAIVARENALQIYSDAVAEAARLGFSPRDSNALDALMWLGSWRRAFAAPASPPAAAPVPAKDQP